MRPANSDALQGVASGGGQTLKPKTIAALSELPEVAKAAGNVNGQGMFLLDPDGKLVGGQAPTIAFNYTDMLNVLGEPALLLVDGAWPSKPTEVVLDAGAAEQATKSATRSRLSPRRVTRSKARRRN